MNDRVEPGERSKPPQSVEDLAVVRQFNTEESRSALANSIQSRGIVSVFAKLTFDDGADFARGTGECHAHIPSLSRRSFSGAANRGVKE